MKIKPFALASILLSFWVNPNAQEYDLSSTPESMLRSRDTFILKVGNESGTLTTTAEYATLADEQLVEVT